jgi:hypothetical protein
VKLHARKLLTRRLATDQAIESATPSLYRKTVTIASMFRAAVDMVEEGVRRNVSSQLIQNEAEALRRSSTCIIWALRPLTSRGRCRSKSTLQIRGSKRNNRTVYLGRTARHDTDQENIQDGTEQGVPVPGISRETGQCVNEKNVNPMNERNVQYSYQILNAQVNNTPQSNQFLLYCLRGVLKPRCQCRKSPWGTTADLPMLVA